MQIAYEWKREEKRKTPFYFLLDSDEPMAMAGLWESWKAPDGTIHRTVCIITTDANTIMRPIHDRMPVIIQRQDWRDWLSGEKSLVAESENAPTNTLSLQRIPADKMLP